MARQSARPADRRARAYGSSRSWLTHVVLTNHPHANDTYAAENNDVDSPLKSFARRSACYGVKAGKAIPVTVTAVGISGDEVQVCRRGRQARGRATMNTAKAVGVPRFCRHRSLGRFKMEDPPGNVRVRCHRAAEELAAPVSEDSLGGSTSWTGCRRVHVSQSHGGRKRDRSTVAASLPEIGPRRDRESLDSGCGLKGSVDLHPTSDIDTCPATPKLPGSSSAAISCDSIRR